MYLSFSSLETKNSGYATVIAVTKDQQVTINKVRTTE